MAKYKPRADKVGNERGLFEHNKAILRKTARVCALCGTPLDPNEKYPSPLSISIDHIIPVALGGRSTLDNLQATHLICNKEKGKKLYVGKRNGKDTDGCSNTMTKLLEEIPQYFDWTHYDSDD